MDVNSFLVPTPSYPHHQMRFVPSCLIPSSSHPSLSRTFCSLFKLLFLSDTGCVSGYTNTDDLETLRYNTRLSSGRSTNSMSSYVSPGGYSVGIVACRSFVLVPHRNATKPHRQYLQSERTNSNQSISNSHVHSSVSSTISIPAPLTAVTKLFHALEGVAGDCIR